jgi:cell wall-active antibiotic response 4TMS protein YvqF
MNTDTSTNYPRFSPRLILGIAILLAGVAFTLDNLGLVDAGEFLDYWPLLLVAVGIAKLVTAPRTGGWLSGGIWVLVGVWWTLFNLAIIDIHPIDLWPVFLIVAGFYLVNRALRPGRRGDSSPDRVTGFAVLGGSTRKSSTQDFKGGDFTAVMGGCEVDLRDAHISEPPAVIDVFAFWGGVEIRVPDNWMVDGQVTAILGGFDNKTGRTGAPDPTQRLIVRGMAMMGGVEVRS